MWITNDTLREKYYFCFFTKYTLGWQRSILLLFADLLCCCWFYRDIWNLFLWEFWIHIAQKWVVMSRKYGLFCCDQIKSKCILYDAYFPQEFSRLANKNCHVTNSMVELIKQITSQFKITPLFFIYFLFFLVKYESIVDWFWLLLVLPLTHFCWRFITLFRNVAQRF